MAGIKHWNEYQNKVKQLKKEVIVLYMAYRDPRVSVWAKMLLGIVVGYALSPVDLIPDFIPVLGLLDDLLLVPLGIYWCLKLIPKEVIEEARSKAGEIRPEQSRMAMAVIVGIWVVVVFWVAGMIIKYF